MTSGYYHQNNNTVINSAPSEASSNSYGTALIEVTPGDILTISGKGVSAARLYATADENLNIKRVAEANLDSRENPITLTIENGEAWFCFNTSVTQATSAGSAFLRKTSVLREGLYDYAHRIGSIKDTKSHFEINALDANFETDLPYSVIGTKGTDSAKYIFSSCLGNAFNIRAKFKITEPIINRGATNYTIVSVGSAQAYVTVSPLSQYKKGRSINGVSSWSFYSTVNGGLTFNGSSASDDDHNLNIGSYAFSVKYTGSNSTASIEVTNSALILKDAETHTFTFTDYSTIYDMYADIAQLTDYLLDYCSIENHTPTDLASFSETNLINQCYINDLPVTTNTPFFVPYANDNKWHQLEIVGINDVIYSVIDGITLPVARNFDITTEQQIILGGDCGVLFKDLIIDTMSNLDAEIIQPKWETSRIISSVNPYIVIYEGHNMAETPNEEISPSDTMAVSSDRIQLLADHARMLGYIPVSVEDVIDYFDGKKTFQKDAIH